MSLVKYPRTRHVRGSKFQHGDDDLEAVPFSELEGKHLVIEEKVDGANCGVSFEDGELKLQSRGHFLRGGPREKQFELLKQWAATHEMALYDLLGERYVVFAEWMFACHTIWYDRLPHYFMEFDVYDKETGKFLSTPARSTLLCHDKANVEIVPVRVLASGYVKGVNELREMIGPSAFISDKPLQTYLSSQLNDNSSGDDEDRILKQSKSHYLGPTMEGLYVKWEEDGEVKGRYKFVRGDFISHIAGQEEHWHDRPIIQNQLVEGALDRMFCQR
jgi:hypothetical protein